MRRRYQKYPDTSSLGHAMDPKHLQNLESLQAENNRLNAELAQLQQSDRRFRTLFDQLPLSTQVVSSEGRILEVNQAWTDLFCVHDPKARDFLFNEYRMFEDPRLLELGITEKLKAAFAGETQHIEPILYTPPQNSGIGHVARHLASVFAPVKGVDGTINEIMLVHHDYTAIKRAEEELRQSRDQLKVILEGVADGITVITPEGKYLYANEEAAKLCGFDSVEEFSTASLEEIVSRFELFDENGRRISARDLPSTAAFAGEEHAPEMVVRFRGKGSLEDRWSILNSKPVLDGAGKVQFVVTIFRDFTERKRTETQMQEREEKFRFLADASKALVSTLDLAPVLSNVAKLAVPEFADWAAVDLIGEDGRLERVAVWHADPEKIRQAEEFHAKYPPDLDAPVGIGKILKTGESELFEDLPESLIRDSLRELPERLADTLALNIRSFIMVPLMARQKVLGAITFVFADSGRRYTPDQLSLAEELGRRAGLAVENARLFQQAQNAVQVRDDFLSIAAHELRTPLTSLSMQLQIMKMLNDKESETPGFPAKLSKKLDLALRQGRSLANLIDGLLDLSRLANRRLALDPAPLDLVKVTRLVADNFAEIAHRSGIELRITAETESCTGNWDSLRVEQAITNLVSNALKYGAGKPVDIEISCDQLAARVRVTDRGLGIAPADQARIFGRFERAISHKDISGLGIGLYITREIALAHGGEVRLEKSVPGQGSTFLFELPFAPAAKSR
jgi:PAS domain S-box-containing protein